MDTADGGTVLQGFRCPLSPCSVVPVDQHCRSAGRGGDDQVGGQGRPTGLVFGAQPHAGVAVEVLVERDIVPPSGVGWRAGRTSRAGQEDGRQPHRRANVSRRKLNCLPHSNPARACRAPDTLPGVRSFPRRPLQHVRWELELARPDLDASPHGDLAFHCMTNPSCVTTCRLWSATGNASWPRHLSMSGQPPGGPSWCETRVVRHSDLAGSFSSHRGTSWPPCGYRVAGALAADG